MIDIFLIRHAKASGKTAGEEDFSRALSKRGRNDARLIGQELLRTHGRTMSQVLCSSSKRTLQTAEMLAAVGFIKSTEIKPYEQLYLADPDEITRVIEDHFPFSTDRIFLIGHNPGMTLLADYIPNVQLDHLPTGSVIHIQYPKESKFWDWANARVESVLIPKMLKS